MVYKSTPMRINQISVITALLACLGPFLARPACAVDPLYPYPPLTFPLARSLNCSTLLALEGNWFFAARNVHGARMQRLAEFNAGPDMQLYKTLVEFDRPIDPRVYRDQSS